MAHGHLPAQYESQGRVQLQTGEGVGITQKTAWFLAHRIRRAFDDQQNAKFVSPIEVDESYIGGKYHNMHKSRKPRMVGAGAQDKTPVVGIRERSTGRIKAKITEPVSGVMLRGRVMETVREGATVYTDQNPSYLGLVKSNYRHEAVNHSVGEYIKAQAHTNGVESFWSMLKRGQMGVIFKGMDGKRLTYRELITITNGQLSI